MKLSGQVLLSQILGIDWKLIRGRMGSFEGRMESAALLNSAHFNQSINVEKYGPSHTLESQKRPCVDEKKSEGWRTLREGWSKNGWRAFGEGTNEQWGELNVVPLQAFYNWLWQRPPQPWHPIQMTQHQLDPSSISPFHKHFNRWLIINVRKCFLIERSEGNSARRLFKWSPP